AKLSDAQRAAALRDAAFAIDHAHREGVVHRDLKPQNILVEPGHPPRVWVTDFGMAKQRSVSTSLSASGIVVGTPAYMPPEQARGRSKEIDATSDVYALGATLYHLLAGRPPFSGEDALAVLDRVVTEEPVPPSKLAEGVSRDLETIALKCMEKSKALRYSSARELAEDLQRHIDGKPIRARPVGPIRRVARAIARRGAWAAALVMSVAFIGALFVYIRSSRIEFVQLPPREVADDGLIVPPPQLPPFAEFSALWLDGTAAFRSGDRVGLGAAARVAGNLFGECDTLEGEELISNLGQMLVWLDVVQAAVEKGDASARPKLMAMPLPEPCSAARERHLLRIDEAVRRKRAELLIGSFADALRAENPAEAEAILRELERLGAEGVQEMSQDLANLAERLGIRAALAQAEKTLTTAQARYDETWSAAADAARRKRGFDEALSMVDEALRKFGSLKAESATARFLRGRILHGQHRWAEARESFDRVGRSDLEFGVRALYWRAAAAYFQAFETDPTLLSDAARDLHAAAEKDLLEAMDAKFDPKHARLMLAVIYERTRRTEQAEKEATAAVDRGASLTDEERIASFYRDRPDPENAFQGEALYVRASARFKRREFKSCLSDCDAILAKRPEEGLAWQSRLLRARALYADPRSYQLALTAAEEVRDRCPFKALKVEAEKLIKENQDRGQ
ncbi:MAG TPA: protein kinase, partial [Planctomycetota bacterium]|nr:protein kinase [Planctomycetota bacterium]